MVDFNYEELDPGIREVVAVLRSHGFETCDSGDGTKTNMECAVPFPMVAVTTSAAYLIGEANRMQSVLDRYRPLYWRVEASYCPNDQTYILLATPEQKAAKA